METRKVKALVAKTEYVPGFGMVVMDNGSKRKELRFPTVPVAAIAELVAKGLVEEADLPQLDHDGDGEPGGSLPIEEAPADLGEARKRYHATFGKNPGPRWTVEQIEAKLAEAADLAPAEAVGEGQAPV